MTDRELLELAAKAAGYMVNANKQAERDALGYGDVGLWIDSVSTCWNPLNDSGSAFELLATMPSLRGLSLKFGAPSIEMDVAWGSGSIVYVEYAGKDVDRASAMRAAIVRAAAEIGMAMK